MIHYGVCPKCGEKRFDYNETNDTVVCRSCGHQENVEDYKERLQANMLKVSWTYNCPICGQPTRYEKYFNTLSEAYDEAEKLKISCHPCDDCKKAIEWVKQQMGTNYKTMYKGYEVVDGNKIIIPIAEYDRLMEEIK